MISIHHSYPYFVQVYRCMMLRWWIYTTLVQVYDYQYRLHHT